MIDYKKYKWFFTSSGKLVVGGKSAEQNDMLLNEMKKMKKEMVVMHTKSPGSPFCVILAPTSLVNESDLDECAIFTGSFSRAWKEGKRSTTVDIFHLSQLNKTKDMNVGTWSVKGRIKNQVVNLKLVIINQQGVLRAVPKITAKKEEILCTIEPGNIDKAKAVVSVKMPTIKKLNKEQLLSAIPAGGVKFS